MRAIAERPALLVDVIVGYRAAQAWLVEDKSGSEWKRLVQLAGMNGESLMSPSDTRGLVVLLLGHGRHYKSARCLHQCLAEAEILAMLNGRFTAHIGATRAWLTAPSDRIHAWLTSEGFEVGVRDVDPVSYEAIVSMGSEL